jgi:dihydroorotate oxidase A (EC 1.3.3.1)
MAVRALARGLVPPVRPFSAPALAVRLWGLDFPNPIGLAAGFDKNAEAVDALLALGFGFVEVGTVTLRAQAGNPRPRLFRLPEARAVINRMGFNNDGAAVVGRRLARRRDEGRAGIVGANIGPNRDCLDPAGDCATVIQSLAAYVDYLVINVSSPNTPGLRDLQRSRALELLLQRAIDARQRANPKIPLLVKIAPDLTPGEIEDIAGVALSLQLDGVIATNTTIARPAGLSGRHRDETGGLSGRPLLESSTAVIDALARATAGRLPLVGVGGISAGADAYAKVRAGASLVQVYTALVYEGPALAVALARQLHRCLQRDGFDCVAAAVGVDRGR